jgi:hypothetical protein
MMHLDLQIPAVPTHGSWYGWREGADMDPFLQRNVRRFVLGLASVMATALPGCSASVGEDTRQCAREEINTPVYGVQPVRPCQRARACTDDRTCRENDGRDWYCDTTHFCTNVSRPTDAGPVADVQGG